MCGSSEALQGTTLPPARKHPARLSHAFANSALPPRLRRALAPTLALELSRPAAPRPRGVGRRAGARRGRVRRAGEPRRSDRRMAGGAGRDRGHRRRRRDRGHRAAPAPRARRADRERAPPVPAQVHEAAAADRLHRRGGRADVRHAGGDRSAGRGRGANRDVRSPDGTAQPHPLPRPGPARGRAVAARRPPHRGLHARRRRLHEREPVDGPRGRRLAADRRRAPAAGHHARDRRARAHGRRRVRDPLRGAGDGRGAGHARAPPDRGHVPPVRGAWRPRGHARREPRHHDLPDGRRRRRAPHRQRDDRAVCGAGGGRRRLPLLLDGAERSTALPHVDRVGPAPRARSRRAAAALPAEGRRRVGPRGRLRGAAPLAASAARPHPARRVHPDRRGHGAHRADRRVGAAPRVHAARGVARDGARAGTGLREPLRAPVQARGSGGRSCSRCSPRRTSIRRCWSSR